MGVPVFRRPARCSCSQATPVSARLTLFRGALHSLTVCGYTACTQLCSLAECVFFTILRWRGPVPPNTACRTWITSVSRDAFPRDQTEKRNILPIVYGLLLTDANRDITWDFNSWIREGRGGLSSVNERRGSFHFERIMASDSPARSLDEIDLSALRVKRVCVCLIKWALYE